MARLNFPNTFAGIVKLFRDVKTKYDAEAGDSMLQPYLDEQGIGMDEDETTVNNAVTADTAFSVAGKESEKLRQQRDFLFEPAFKRHEGEVQFLKKLYRNNVAKLGEWGVTVDSDDRVVYPPDFPGRQAAVIAFITKHESFAVGTSPLLPYLTENVINIVTDKAAAVSALAAHNSFLTEDNVREEKRMERDVLIEPVATHLRGEGQYLIGLFHSVPKKANEWGFEVDDSPQADVVRTGIIASGASKVLKNLNVGKTLRNIGAVPLNVFPGETPEGTPVVVNAGQTFEIIRGFGSMTVVNPDDEQNGEYEATFNR